MGQPEDEGREVTDGLRRWNPEEALRSLVEERSVLGEDPEDTARRIFKENLPLAATSIVHIATQSDNEKTRLTAAQYIVDRNFGKTTPDGDIHSDSDIYSAFLADCVKESERADGGPS
jgi:hypothetical protein